MPTIKLTTDNDIDLGSNNIELISGPAEFAQKLATDLRFVLGEWLIDTSQGYPVFERVLAKNANPAVAAETIKSVIRGVPGFLEILQFDSALNGAARQFSVNTRIKTDSGVVDFNREFIFDG